MHYKREKGTWDWRPGDSTLHHKREKGAWDWKSGDSTFHYNREKEAWDWESGDSTLHYKREKGTWDWKSGDLPLHYKREKGAGERSVGLEIGRFNFALFASCLGTSGHRPTGLSERRRRESLASPGKLISHSLLSYKRKTKSESRDGGRAQDNTFRLSEYD